MRPAFLIWPLAGQVAGLVFDCLGAGSASEGLQASGNSRFACSDRTPIFWSSAFELAVDSAIECTIQNQFLFPIFGGLHFAKGMQLKINIFLAFVLQ